MYFFIQLLFVCAGLIRFMVHCCQRVSNRARVQARQALEEPLLSAEASDEQHQADQHAAVAPVGPVYEHVNSWTFRFRLALELAKQLLINAPHAAVEGYNIFRLTGLIMSYLSGAPTAEELDMLWKISQAFTLGVDGVAATVIDWFKHYLSGAYGGQLTDAEQAVVTDFQQQEQRPDEDTPGGLVRLPNLYKIRPDVGCFALPEIDGSSAAVRVFRSANFTAANIREAVDYCFPGENLSLFEQAIAEGAGWAAAGLHVWWALHDGNPTGRPLNVNADSTFVRRFDHAWGQGLMGNSLLRIAGVLANNARWAAGWRAILLSLGIGVFDFFCSYYAVKPYAYAEEKRFFEKFYEWYTLIIGSTAEALALVNTFFADEIAFGRHQAGPGNDIGVLAGAWVLSFMNWLALRRPEIHRLFKKARLKNYANDQKFLIATLPGSDVENPEKRFVVHSIDAELNVAFPELSSDALEEQVSEYNAQQETKARRNGVYAESFSPLQLDAMSDTNVSSVKDINIEGIPGIEVEVEEDHYRFATMGCLGPGYWTTEKLQLKVVEYLENLSGLVQTILNGDLAYDAARQDKQNLIKYVRDIYSKLRVMLVLGNHEQAIFGNVFNLTSIFLAWRRGYAGKEKAFEAAQENFAILKEIVKETKLARARYQVYLNLQQKKAHLEADGEDTFAVKREMQQFLEEIASTTTSFDEKACAEMYFCAENYKSSQVVRIKSCSGGPTTEIFCLNSSTFPNDKSAQQEFIRALNASTADHIMLVFHHPLLSFNARAKKLDETEAYLMKDLPPNTINDSMRRVLREMAKKTPKMAKIKFISSSHDHNLSQSSVVFRSLVDELLDYLKTAGEQLRWFSKSVLTAGLGFQAIVDEFDDIYGPGAFNRLGLTAHAENFDISDPGLPMALAMVVRAIIKEKGVLGLSHCFDREASQFKAMLQGFIADFCARYPASKHRAEFCPLAQRLSPDASAEDLLAALATDFEPENLNQAVICGGAVSSKDAVGTVPEGPSMAIAGKGATGVEIQSFWPDRVVSSLVQVDAQGRGHVVAETSFRTNGRRRDFSTGISEKNLEKAYLKPFANDLAWIMETQSWALIPHVFLHHAMSAAALLAPDEFMVDAKPLDDPHPAVDVSADGRPVQTVNRHRGMDPAQRISLLDSDGASSSNAPDIELYTAEEVRERNAAAEDIYAASEARIPEGPPAPLSSKKKAARAAKEKADKRFIKEGVSLLVEGTSLQMCQDADQLREFLAVWKNLIRTIYNEPGTPKSDLYSLGNFLCYALKAQLAHIESPAFPQSRVTVQVYPQADALQPKPRLAINTAAISKVRKINADVLRLCCLAFCEKVIQEKNLVVYAGDEYQRPARWLQGLLKSPEVDARLVLAALLKKGYAPMRFTQELFDKLANTIYEENGTYNPELPYNLLDQPIYQDELVSRDRLHQVDEIKTILIKTIQHQFGKKPSGFFNYSHSAALDEVMKRYPELYPELYPEVVVAAAGG